METRYRRWATLPDRRATGNRGGDRGRRAEPNAGAGTPGVRPHRITRNTGRAQCARTADPCNKVAFWLIAWISVLGILLVFLLRRPPPNFLTPPRIAP